MQCIVGVWWWEHVSSPRNLLLLAPSNPRDTKSSLHLALLSLLCRYVVGEGLGFVVRGFYTINSLRFCSSWAQFVVRCVSLLGSDACSFCARPVLVMGCDTLGINFLCQLQLGSTSFHYFSLLVIRLFLWTIFIVWCCCVFAIGCSYGVPPLPVSVQQFPEGKPFFSVISFYSVLLRHWRSRLLCDSGWLPSCDLGSVAPLVARSSLTLPGKFTWLLPLSQWLFIVVVVAFLCDGF